jgi:heptosyltransferase-1
MPEAKDNRQLLGKPKILVVKTSSMGDVIHTFPAITDLKTHLPNALIHWVVEQGFSELASLHPAINRVIPVRIRRWLRERTLGALQELVAWRQVLTAESYDIVIDAQGLLKSSWICKLPKSNEIHGYDFKSCREPLATWAYTRTHRISNNLHATRRTQLLFASAAGYKAPEKTNFGLRDSSPPPTTRMVALVIGASWENKLWPDSHWAELANLARDTGFEVEVIWGAPSEYASALKIQSLVPDVRISPSRLSIVEVGTILARASVTVGLDTGFSHLSSALNTPTVAVYGPTAPLRCGLTGPSDGTLTANEIINCPPCHKRACKLVAPPHGDHAKCMESVRPQAVWNAALEAATRLRH